VAELPTLTPDNLQFVLLSFEGPDEYAMAGGLGMRMKELGLELARGGFRTHHVFIGDPKEPPCSRPENNLILHRWGQWLSEYHPAGVYAGEEAKLADWNGTVPSYVVDQLIGPAAEAGIYTAVMAEEWHTAHSVCDLSDLLWARGQRQRSILLWTANNVMGFDRIDWPRLNFCSQVATVSRYMKHLMWAQGVNPVVIPNGIPEQRLKAVPLQRVRRLRQALAADTLLFKIGRWSPDKRWNMAVHAVARLKADGADVRLAVRGGIEPHAEEVLTNARRMGLVVEDVKLPRLTKDVVEACEKLPQADIYNIRTFLSDETVSLFYRAADGVLANSGHEPFGLVGLEVMAAGGIPYVGSTGEDYAIPYLNSVVLDSDDPAEIAIAVHYLRDHPKARERIRKEARATAKRFTWRSVIDDILITKLEYVAALQAGNGDRP